MKFLNSESYAHLFCRPRQQSPVESRVWHFHMDSRRATLLLQIEGEESSGLADSLCRAPFCP
ncbi:protein of unknown function [Methylocella tundrae]|uniref:Uncharacterized protein n=1 Tax=Methylocella tundrae TaxID=227605 RepID=A0A4U8Z338_METTU|nr:protein of unknown function [Methylocella tundrae]